MKKIDIENWARKSHYEWFSSFADPCLSLIVRMDITNLLDYCSKNKISTFASITYIVCKSLNSNQAMRLRILDNEVYEIENANVAYTLMAGDACFVNCKAKTNVSFSEFSKQIQKNKEDYGHEGYVQKTFNNTSIIDDIYCSCVPWLDFVSVQQPIPDKSKESNSIPRIVWGKYVKDNEKTYMSLNITANHALVDGIDIANVFKQIQNYFNYPSNLLGE